LTKNSSILQSKISEIDASISKLNIEYDNTINEANKNAERLVFLRILAPNGDIIEDVPLQESDLDNLPKMFKTLPDERYQIYLKEAGEERVRLLMDVDIRNGKASDVTEEQSAPPTESDSGNDANQQKTSQLSTEDSLVKVAGIIAGGPAELDGQLKEGDRIIAVAQENQEENMAQGR